MPEETQQIESKLVAHETTQRRRGLSKIKRVRLGGESRTIILEHESCAGRECARIVQVNTGGVDRITGESRVVFYEVTVKLPGKPEVTRTFSSEYNARVAYLVAQYGAVDFTTPLEDLTGPRLWAEPRNMTALARLREAGVAPDTHINSGDSGAKRSSGREATPTPRLSSQETRARELACWERLPVPA